MESLSADIERTASDFEALDQYETLRERERKSRERSDAARKAAIEAADKWKAAHQPSSRPASPMSMLENGDLASEEVKVTRSKSRLNMKGATESRDGNFAFQDMDNCTVHGLNRVEAEPVEQQSCSRDGDADEPVVELKGHHNIHRNRQRNGSIDGTQSPGFEEWKQAREAHHRRAERSSWRGASAPHVLRTLVDYDDQVYWSDSAEDIIDPDQDNVGKAEELAEELYRVAMELHKSLVAEADMTAAMTTSLHAMTKEIASRGPSPSRKPHSAVPTLQTAYRQKGVSLTK